MPPHAARPRNLTALEPLELALLPPEGLSFDEPLPESWLARELAPPPGAPAETALQPAHPGHLQLVVVPLGPLDQRPPIQVRGALSADLTTSCVRCLEEVSVRLAAETDVTLLPDRSALEGDVHRGSAEPTYSGRRVDLPSIVRETLLLEVAPHPVCDDATACDTRTRALLDEVNRAAEEAAARPDPRWAQLSTLSTGEEG